MAGPSVSEDQCEETFHSLHDDSGSEDLSILVLPFVFNRPISHHNDGSDVESLGDGFDSCDEENDSLSDYPSELDFLDQKREQICRRNGGKKLSNTVKAKRNRQRSTPEVIPTPETNRKGTADNEICPSNKELRIREKRMENGKRKRENKIKAKKMKEITEDNLRTRTGVQLENEKKPPKSCLRKSVKKTPENTLVNQTAKPPTFYNNSDFILSSGNNGVKFEDQSYINLLIELQNREITPEDYDLLAQLDCSVQPKTLPEAQITRLQSDTVTSEINDTCSICIEDYVPGDMRKFLPCGHHFHNHCIRTWLGTTSDRCPIDGKEVRLHLSYNRHLPL